MPTAAVRLFDLSVHDLARSLIGCTLLYEGRGGVIIETESYDRDDPACHAFRGRTARTEVMFGPPGNAYVYLSYGIHPLLNIVAESEGHAAAVLIRAIEPAVGVEEMRERRPGRADHELCSGPGRLTSALGIALGENGADISRPPFDLIEREGRWAAVEIHQAPRIGITKAVDLPWRFCAAGNRFVSKPHPW